MANPIPFGGVEKKHLVRLGYGLLMMVPFVAIGVLFGTLLKRRQATAKNAVQRHVDEAVFQSGKYSRDALRKVQRTLRGHFTALAEDLQEAATASITDATKAANREAVERDRRNREIAGQLERLMSLRRRAESVLAVRGIAA